MYSPNGRTPDSEHYVYKLAWFAALACVVWLLVAAALRVGMAP